MNKTKQNKPTNISNALVKCSFFYKWNNKFLDSQIPKKHKKLQCVQGDIRWGFGQLCFEEDVPEHDVELSDV